ncbi:hypothetical protein [Duganella qianjiadongensis]|uniref:CopG family transcriptional regulator n=1 Tax=Duganella qianjiadongensis TaxID=2692176 RepID=A0ABW9VFA7_9BURK|nr:hypothetical protein [Duganella qianjiadongensis]MYM38294.1 hypothetical protein [Duganella qianjiadongensis]
MNNINHEGQEPMEEGPREAGCWVPIANPFAAGGGELRLRLHKDVIAYFASIGADAGWPAERIMELYLRNIARSGYRIPLELTSIKEFLSAKQ